MLDEPLDVVAARQLAVGIVETGDVRVTTHARKELEKDGLDEQDALNAITKGVVPSIDFEKGTWRYQFRVPR